MTAGDAAAVREARAVAHRAVTEGVNLKYVESLRRETYKLADLADKLLAEVERLQQERDEACPDCGKEVGEAIEKLIEWTGQNPRKPQRDGAREDLLAELADVAITATLAIQHFTKDADETVERLDARLTFLYQRMRAADPEWFEISP